QLFPRGPSPQFGTGANNRNTLYGFSGWFVYTVDQQPLTGAPIAASVGDMNLDLQSDCMCAEDSTPDPTFTNNLGTGALATLPGFGCSPQWKLASTSILAADTTAGTAILSGELVAQTNPNCRLAFQLTLQGRLEPGNPGYPPNGSPSIAHILPGGLFA